MSSVRLTMQNSCINHKDIATIREYPRVKLATGFVLFAARVILTLIGPTYCMILLCLIIDDDMLERQILSSWQCTGTSRFTMLFLTPALLCMQER